MYTFEGKRKGKFLQMVVEFKSSCCKILIRRSLSKAPCLSWNYNNLRVPHKLLGKLLCCGKYAFVRAHWRLADPIPNYLRRGNNCNLIPNYDNIVCLCHPLKRLTIHPLLPILHSLNHGCTLLSRINREIFNFSFTIILARK